MSEVSYGQVRAHFAPLAYRAPASVETLAASCYPSWIKALFVGGILALVTSLVMLTASAVLPGLPRTDVLFGTAATGLAALWIVATVAPRHRVKR